MDRAALDEGDGTADSSKDFCIRCGPREFQVGRKKSGAFLSSTTTSPTVTCLRVVWFRTATMSLAAASGAEAFICLSTDHNFDLVLLDLLMPDMNGIEILTRLKADERLHQIPVIMISGLQETEADP